MAAWAARQPPGHLRTEQFAADYLGHHDSLTAWASSIIEQHGYQQAAEAAVPAFLRAHVQIDAARFGRDLERDGAIIEKNRIRAAPRRRAYR